MEEAQVCHEGEEEPSILSMIFKIPFVFVHTRVRLRDTSNILGYHRTRRSPYRQCIQTNSIFLEQ